MIRVHDDAGNKWTVDELCDMSESLGRRVEPATMRARIYRRLPVAGEPPLYPFGWLIRAAGKARGRKGGGPGNPHALAKEQPTDWKWLADIQARVRR